MKNNLAIKIENVTKVYFLYARMIDRLKEFLHPLRRSYHRDFNALTNLSFEIKKGETVGIIGKNGAGKSTLLKILTGITFPTKGNVQVNGKIASLLELGAGFNPEMTGMENIYFNGTLMGYSKDEMDERVDEILAFADIGEFIHQPVKMYSSGMFARLAFSLAINVDPNILIIDEALSVGDIFFVEKCIKKIQEFIDNTDKTLLFVSHDMTVLRRLVKRVIWLEDSKIKMDGNSLEVLDKYAATKLLAIDVLEDDLDHISSEFSWRKLRSRFGTGDVIIDAVRVNNNLLDFNTVSSMETFETLTIEIRYSNKNLIEKNITFSVAFFNKDGVNCFGVSPYNQDVEMESMSGTVKCTLKSIPLLRGQYTLSIGIWDKMVIVPYDLQERVYIFNVISKDNSEDGIFVPQYIWETIA